MKYLGTDDHSRKVMTGKFASNVLPKNFSKGRIKPEPWECPECENVNREYLLKCFKCSHPKEG